MLALAVGTTIGQETIGACQASPQHLLMQAAKAVMKVKGDSEEVSWLSSHELLIVTTTQEAYIGTDIPPGPLHWKGYVDLVDTQTHTRTRLRPLSKLMNETTSFTSDVSGVIVPSPDGQWFVWETHTNRGNWYTAHVAHRDGTQHRELGDNFIEEQFFLDARHLAHMEEQGGLMTIHDLQNPRKDQEYTSRQKVWAVLQPYATRHPLFVVPDFSPMGTHLAVAINYFRMQDRPQLFHVKSYRQETAPKPVRTRKMNLPEEARVQEIAVSPQQKTLLYHLQLKRQPLRLSLAPTGSPKAEIERPAIAALWVSRTDGSEMREIGHLLMPSSGKGFDDAQLKQLQWLPDGKRISFVYQDTLYVVSTEGKRL